MEDIDLLGYQQFVMKFRSLTRDAYNSNSSPFRVPLSNFKNRPPIISYGCILQRKDKYCCLKRKFSIEYTDFLRGNYRESHLYFLLYCMSLNERELLQKDFGFQWVNHCGKPTSGDPYEYAYYRYNQIKPYLPKLLEFVPTVDPEGKRSCLWPKGRIDFRPALQERWCHSPTLDPFAVSNYNLHDQNQETCQQDNKQQDKYISGCEGGGGSESEDESPLTCALREFKEETNGYEIKEEWALSPQPLSESHLGTNSKNYQTYYFCFRCPDGTEFPEQKVENIGETISWLTKQEIMDTFPQKRVDIFNSFDWDQPTPTNHETRIHIAPEWKVPSQVHPESDVLYDE